MQQQQGGMMRNSPPHGSSGGHSRHFDNFLSPLVKTGTGASNRSYAFFSLFLFLLLGAFLSTRLLLDPSVLIEKETVAVTERESTKSPKYPQSTELITEKPKEFTIHCAGFTGNETVTCPRNNYPTSFRPGARENDSDRSPSATCPDYFRWIHEDLRPWEKTGITREALERANATANFRLVIINGRIYVEKLREAFQTRDVFTIWGFVQLLRKYPGKIPDLELMFDCVDWPVVRAAEFSGVDQSTPMPPPLFRYCGNNETLDIVFPDWSYWGWAEVNIKPWESLLKDLREGNKRTKWEDREPYAYWKGNPTVAETRQDLMKCNVSEEYDWKARLYPQDWARESKEGYKQSDLASQCHHRYKIYIEGSAWSVSEKYILACDSVTLLVKPHYYDFFTRGMFPGHHYWPVKEDDKCRSIKFAVDWGNMHMRKAQDIGKKASEFVQQELKMDYVYDYMYHLLTQYSKLLRFKPEIPKNATELCSEAMACPRDGNERKFMMESLVKRPADTSPCAMPPPYDPASFFSVLKRRESTASRIEQWESKYWRKQNRTGSLNQIHV